MFGKKEDGIDLGSDDDEASVASEAGVDDAGAMSKSSYSLCQLYCVLYSTDHYFRTCDRRN